jgi:hypothetical protein
MRHSQLSNEQILLALSESYNIVAAITKYQVGHILLSWRASELPKKRRHTEFSASHNWQPSAVGSENTSAPKSRSAGRLPQNSSGEC